MDNNYIVGLALFIGFVTLTATMVVLVKLARRRGRGVL